MRVPKVNERCRVDGFPALVLIVYATASLACGILGSFMAQSKGRSRMAWFLASLILGPIATFIIVVTDDPAINLPSDQAGAVGSSQDADSRHEADR